MRRPVGRHGERGHDDRDDAGDVKIAVGDDETEIGEAHGDRSDRGIGVAQSRQNNDGHPRHGEAQCQTAGEFPQEHADRRGRIGRHGG